MPLSPGQVLNSRYRIAKLVEQSEFGAVYRAWDTTANGPCAVEELSTVSETAQAQFTQQAPGLLNLSHPHLPKVLDVFDLPEQGIYLVTEFIEGESLQTMLERTGGPLSEAQTLTWTNQVCDALSYLHSQTPAVVHANVKPASIRITAQNQAVLVNLGLASLYDPKSKSIPGIRAVTPSFSPPEQYGKGSLEAYSDVYALGATLYALLTGAPPPESTLIKGKDAPPPPPAQTANPQVSPHVSAALQRAMQIEPAQRFSSLQEFKTALSGVQPETKLAPSEAKRPASPLAAPPPKQWPIFVGIALIAILCLAAVIAGAWYGYGYIQDYLATDTPHPTATQEKATATNTPEWTHTPSPTEAEAATETPALQGQQIEDEFGVPMVLVEAGPFTMGATRGPNDERPVHTITLDAYYIDLYEVTNARYAECVTAGKCQVPIETRSATHEDYYNNQEFADFPVIYVNWSMAQDYCEWRGARLPTEAEWEKAARGSDERMFPWEQPQSDCSFANFWNKEPSCVGEVVAVGSYPQGASPYGLLDMAGNVWEWVMDWFGPEYYATSPAENPTGPNKGDYRVVRGGSWNGGPSQIRVTTRGRNLPNKAYNYVGFRCARVP